ncbi:MAG: SH3 domain-containing protein [Acidobacteriota bacterium]|nr:SH3 domain-containing protein [Acidobacteriota bacterium]
MGFRSFSILSAVLFLLAIPSFPQSDVNGIQIEINAPKLTVFDTATQVLMQQGFSLVTTNERIGLLTTDYRDAKESFGNALMLNLMGRKDVEYMISTSITAANGKSILSLYPKGRMKKVNRLGVATYEDFEPNKKATENFRPLAEKIKTLSEQNAGTAASAPAPVAPKQEETKPAPAAPPVAAAAVNNVEIPYARVKVAAANIRQAASLQGAIIKGVTRGSEYKVVGTEGDWLEIMIDEKNVGYINKAVCESFSKTVYTESVPAAPAAPAAPVAPAATIAPPAQPAASVAKAKVGGEKKILFGVGPSFSLAMGSWTNHYSVGFGLDLQILFNIFNHLYIGGSFGTSLYPGESHRTIFRLQPMFQAQYRYPVNKKLVVFGGFGMGCVIDSERHYDDVDTETGFAADLVAGIRFGSFYIAPRIRLVSYDNDSYSSIDFPIGIYF